MKLMIDIFYLSLLSIVPKKAILGSHQVAATIFSIISSLNVLVLLLWLSFLLSFRPTNNEIKIIVVIVLAANFLFSRVYFLNKSNVRKINQLEVRYSKRWLKVIGFCILISTYILFAASGVIMTLLKEN